VSVHASVLFAAVVSAAKQQNLFRDVISHEPKNAPGTGLHCAVWWDGTVASGRSSGLASVTAVVTFQGRIYSNMLAEPQDEIDPDLMDAAHQLMGAYAMSFTFGGQVRMADLTGSEGAPMSCRPGYITIGQAMFRAAELTLPLVVNDMWEEVP
jgi:hypothetical protein